MTFCIPLRYFHFMQFKGYSKTFVAALCIQDYIKITFVSYDKNATNDDSQKEQVVKVI